MYIAKAMSGAEDENFRWVGKSSEMTINYAKHNQHAKDALLGGSGGMPPPGKF